MDFTERVRAMRFEALVFQNIFKYAAGSTPWGNPGGREFQPQEIDDNLLEVMGMWSKTIVSGWVWLRSLCLPVVIIAARKVRNSVQHSSTTVNCFCIIIKYFSL